MKILNLDIRTSLPDSAALPLSAFFSDSFTAFSPDAVTILKRDFYVRCSRLQKNPVNLVGLVVGCFYQVPVDMFASLTVFRGRNLNHSGPFPSNKSILKLFSVFLQELSCLKVPTMVYKFRVELTTRTIAALLGVTDRRVRDIAKELKLKPSRIGPTMVFSESDLNKMKSRNTKPGIRPRRNGARR